MAEDALDLSTADAVSDRYRQTCGQCGKRRMCTDYVWLGTIPGLGVTLCDECSVRSLSG